MKLSQSQRADAVVRDHISAHRIIETLESLHRQLDAVLAEAQNTVATGGRSDGTIDAKRFDALRSVERSAHGLIVYLRRL